MIRQLILLLFLFGAITVSQSQETIKTDVFTLSSCEPTSLSLVKTNDPANRTAIKRLEVRSNRPSVFRITCINPLRYKYYINNEAVTQFIENNPLSFSLNNFTNGDIFSGAPEIRVPEIFKTDSISSKIKATIRELESKVTVLEDSVELTESGLDNLWSSKYASDTNLQKASASYYSDTNYKKLESESSRLQSRLEKALKEYFLFTSNLTLNNPRFLDQFKNVEFAGNNDLDSIMSYQTKFAFEYDSHTVRLKAIEKGLFEYEKSGYYPDPPAEFFELLQYYSFVWNWPRTYNLYNRASRSSIFRRNVSQVRKQILNKRFQLYEEFTLAVATKVGVLVQNLFREYSSFNNALENYNFIDNQILDSINKSAQKLKVTFAYIQKTSAQLQIMVSYLDINTELYQNIARKINSNYVFLLTYLKNLEFVMGHNTVQYTLPTHTNLKNIDLLRYTIKREDKVTKNTQTYNYDFWIRGGLKIDFSVGFFGTGLTDNLYNKVLLDTVGGIDKIRITRQDNGRMSIAFGGMVNITPRNGAGWLNFGGSVGVAYSTNQKLQILTGLAFHLGKTERICINAGVAFGTVKYLDISANDFKFYNRDLKEFSREKLGDIKENDRVYMLQSPAIKFSTYTIPTVDKFSARPFFGISYNLSKKNALQAVSGQGLSTYNDNLSTAK